MNKLLKTLVIMLAACASLAHASAGLWVQEKALGLDQYLAGLKTENVQVGDHTWHIYTRRLDSKLPCIVMVHGFTARGAHWFRMARHLPEDRCIIIPDLPGFGDSTFIPTANYDPEAQADRLAALLAVVPHVNPQFDLVGNSMGGFIIAEFALRHPEQTHSLGLIDAAGVSSPVPSLLRTQIDKGQNAFFAKDTESYRKFYAMTMSKSPYVPDFVLDAVGTEAIKRNARHEYIFNQINKAPLLDNRLSSIKVPTLIVWGDKDQLLNISMMHVWQGIPGSRASTLNGVGHMPHLEEPADTAELYTRFLENRL